MFAPIVLVAIFGVLLPWYKGLDFLDPVIIAAYCCLGPLFAGPATARSMAGKRPGTAREAWRQMIRPAALGEGLAILLVVAGTVTVNISVGISRGAFSLHLPELDTLAEAGLLGIAGTAAFGAIAAWVTLRFSARAAHRTMRALFLLLAFAFLYRSRRLPEVALQGAGICAVVAAVMIFLVYRFLTPSPKAADSEPPAPGNEARQG